MKKSYIKPRMRVIDTPELMDSSAGLNAYSGMGNRKAGWAAKGNSFYEEEEEESWCEDPRLVTGFEVPGL